LDPKSTYTLGSQLATQPKSRAELTQRITCPRPLRARPDDQVVEVLLHAYQRGRFARNPHWLPQDRENVEVIAGAEDGALLAIEHTRVFSFDRQPEQEKVLRPIAECLESVRLPDHLSDRWFQVYFRPNFIGKGLQKHLAVVLQEVSKWAVRELPGLAPRGHDGYPLRIPISLPSGKALSIQVEVEVWDDMLVGRPISVSGILPGGSRLVTVVRKALENKLPKLAATSANLRFLLIDLPGVADSDNGILKVIRKLAPKFPLLGKIQGLVFAKTFGFREHGVIFFSVWDVATQTWSDHLQATIA
jgi:hypothetical protein